MPPPFARAGHLIPCLRDPTGNFPEKTWLENPCFPVQVCGHVFQSSPRQRWPSFPGQKNMGYQSFHKVVPRGLAQQIIPAVKFTPAHFPERPQAWRTGTLDKASSRAKDGTCSSSDDIVAAWEHKKCKARNPTFDTPYSTCLFQLLLSKRQEREHNKQRKLQQHKFNLGNGPFFQMFETTNLLRLP